MTDSVTGLLRARSLDNFLRVIFHFYSFFYSCLPLYSQKRKYLRHLMDILSACCCAQLKRHLFESLKKFWILLTFILNIRFFLPKLKKISKISRQPFYRALNFKSFVFSVCFLLNSTLQKASNISCLFTKNGETRRYLHAIFQIICRWIFLAF